MAELSSNHRDPRFQGMVSRWTYRSRTRPPTSARFAKCSIAASVSMGQCGEVELDCKRANIARARCNESCVEAPGCRELTRTARERLPLPHSCTVQSQSAPKIRDLVVNALF